MITFFLINTIGNKGLQISSFIFFVLITFDLCIGIGKSKKFTEWIGYELD